MASGFNIPDGGCLKANTGTWYQVFDAEGHCVEQRFVAGNSEYEDKEGKLIHPDDPRLNHYCHFVPEDPCHHCPQFTCSGCGGHRLEEVLENVTVSSEVVNVGPDGDLDYNGSTNEDGDVVRYQCLTCGQIVQDADGDTITSSEDLSEALGIASEDDGTNGQDRESYSDNQDRDSYSVE